MLSFIAVGLGGAIGAILRYSITMLMNNLQTPFPFGTFISNVIAGFFCGAFIYINRNTSMLNPTVALFITTGIMGGLSTFSTFSVETVNLFKNSDYVLGSINILANLICCLSSVVLGIQVAKKFI
ncbi:MAG: fluoride efflux transporter CrcB [Clostridiales Family XIII bacterium]|nr:fluoride efflux transporter CrcB [Clostridiales Family XIII bacterium]